MYLKRYTVVRKQVFRSMRKYVENDRKSIAKSHRKLNKSQPLDVQIFDFSNLGWCHARSDFDDV